MLYYRALDIRTRFNVPVIRLLKNEGIISGVINENDGFSSEFRIQYGLLRMTS